MFYFLRYKLLKSIKPRSFNKRSKLSSNNQLESKYSCSLLTKKQFFFEYIYIKSLKIIFKTLLKYKFSIFKKLPFFFFLKPNLPISNKPKNSRMGKGVGKLLTWVFMIRANSFILSFGTFLYKRFFFLLKILKKRISKNFYIFSSSSNF